MKLIINEKYVPFAKTSGEQGLENSRVWARAKERGQDYLYYVGLYDNCTPTFDDEPIKEEYCVSGDFFSPIDVTLFKESKQKIENMNIHNQILESLKLEIGDLVKITHKVPTKNLGWTASWQPEMDKYVGKTGVVEQVYTCGSGVKVRIDGDYWSFPGHVIELISKQKPVTTVKISSEYTAKIYPGDRIEVACQTIDKKTFEKIIKEFNK